ncbi:MAG: hypothetical protein ISS70_26035 [Phycisphaerae bacterium]|nr:hypothetical protein [Phycisphaerae bacterium]
MAEDIRLLKTQRNSVFDILVEYGLEPAAFRWSTLKSTFSPKGPVSMLMCHNTSFYCRFDSKSTHPGAYRLVFSPGISTRVATSGDISWEVCVTQVVRNWVRCLKRELDTPDLWQEVEKYRSSLSLTPPENLVNEPIPAYEVEQITQNLQLLAAQTNELHGLSEDQDTFVRSKLAYLADAAKRQGRLDWMHTFIGVLISIVIGLAMAPDRAKEFWELVKQLCGRFIYFLPLQ